MMSALLDTTKVNKHVNINKIISKTTFRVFISWWRQIMFRKAYNICSNPRTSNITVIWKFNAQISLQMSNKSPTQASLNLYRLKSTTIWKYSPTWARDNNNFNIVLTRLNFLLHSICYKKINYQTQYEESYAITCLKKSKFKA